MIFFSISEKKKKIKHQVQLSLFSCTSLWYSANILYNGDLEVNSIGD